MENEVKTMSIDRMDNYWIAKVGIESKAFNSFEEAAEWATEKLYGGDGVG